LAIPDLFSLQHITRGVQHQLVTGHLCVKAGKGHPEAFGQVKPVQQIRI